MGCQMVPGKTYQIATCIGHPCTLGKPGAGHRNGCACVATPPSTSTIHCCKACHRRLFATRMAPRRLVLDSREYSRGRVCCRGFSPEVLPCRGRETSVSWPSCCAARRSLVGSHPPNPAPARPPLSPSTCRGPRNSMRVFGGADVNAVRFFSSRSSAHVRGLEPSPPSARTGDASKSSRTACPCGAVCSLPLTRPSPQLACQRRDSGRTVGAALRVAERARALRSPGR